MSRRRTDAVIEQADYVSIGELVRLTGMRYSTLKFYVEEGLLPFEQQDSNMTRRFPRLNSIARLSEINALKRQGCHIDKIKELLLQ